MKCFLLLAAVYSLIIHQWHKEKETAQIKVKNERQLADKEKQDPAGNPVTTAIHFQKIISGLYND